MENLKKVELGGRAICYTYSGTSDGDLFIKIDMDSDAFSFIESFKNSEVRRKEQTDLCWKNMKNTMPPT
jgi:hypothetical protein